MLAADNQPHHHVALIDRAPVEFKVGVLGEVLREVAELAARRVEAGEHQQGAHVDEHGVAERLPVHLRGEQVRDEVGLRIEGS
jgi:hypothetical protein